MIKIRVVAIHYMRWYGIVLMCYTTCCVSVGGDLALNFILNIEPKRKKGRGKLNRVPN